MNSSHGVALSEEVHILFLDFEARHSYDKYREFAIHRPWLPVTGILIYVSFIILGQQFMRRRRHAFTVKWFMFAWNFSLSAFSMMASIRFTCTLMHQYRSFDRRGFFCFTNNDNVTGFWFMLFVYSKFVEFGDTVFLILRKKEIMFLHWYHHTSVLLMSWIVFVTKSSVGPFFGGVNVFIHSLMYAYYALQTIGVRVPKICSMILTSLQMVQMVIGILVVGVTHFYLTTSPSGCGTTNLVTICGAAMYSSYLYLFARFFYDSYMRPVNKKEK